MRRWCSWPSLFSSRKGCCCCSGSAALGPLQHAAAAAAAAFQAALPKQWLMAIIGVHTVTISWGGRSTETAGAAQHTGAQHSSAQRLRR
jgi:hypothetical protein